jgi:hypothetical protein
VCSTLADCDVCGTADRQRSMGTRPHRLTRAHRTYVNTPHHWWGFVLHGAKGRTRTGDRTIFSRELYQLSYLGMH